jgi:hypothetical protein
VAVLGVGLELERGRERLEKRGVGALGEGERLREGREERAESVGSS